ncbi:MAG: porin family protein [Gammaproteobacteria bacterium]|nr:porin family protein [Gammaproteobacteria bacterium]
MNQNIIANCLAILLITISSAYAEGPVVYGPSYSSTSDGNIYGDIMIGMADFYANDIDSDNEFSFGLRAGFQFNQLVALEAELLKTTLKIENTEIDSDNVSIGGRIGYPISNAINLYARLGICRWAFTFENEKIHDEEPYLGIGARFKVNQSQYIGIEYTNYNLGVNETDIDLRNFTLVSGYKF